MKKSIQLICVVQLAALFLAHPLDAATSKEPPVLRTKEVRFLGAGGLAIINRHHTTGAAYSLGVGLADRVAYGAPLALAVRIVDVSPLNSLYIAGGVVDVFITREGDFLYAPLAAVAASIQIGVYSSFRASIDISGAEQGFQKGRHGVWLRGAGSILIDVGAYVTLGLGVGYQRQLTSLSPPEEIARLGWVGDARFSFGSVRSHPLSETPMLSIHLQKYMDLIGIVRFDLNTTENTNDSRFLIGIQLHR